jgi:hypothetical protein
MHVNPGPLKAYEKNLHSQFGEDGIIAELFRRIGVRWSTCIEFGAWDGLHLSNTVHLWRSLGWQALLIEGDPEKYRTLLQTTAQHPQVRTLNRMVKPQGPARLENLIEEAGFPREIDLLSIDIDGDDIYILEGLERIRPRVIVIEFNPTIPAHLNVRQGEGEYFGASALAVLSVARAKGYRLAHATEVNLFLVHGSEWAQLGFSEPELREVLPQNNLTYLITSYGGSVFLSRDPVYFRYGGTGIRGIKLGPYQIARRPGPVPFPTLAPGGDSLVKAEVKLNRD